jgi:hypothetical protein
MSPEPKVPGKTPEAVPALVDDETTVPTASNLESAIEYEITRREATPGPADEEKPPAPKKP